MSDDQKTELDSQQDAKQAEADKINATRTGVGTRMFVGRTRGKGSVVISYEQFDDTKPETLPKSVQEFVTVTKVADDAELTKLLITGYNDLLYTAASDPLAEHVEDYWPEDAKLQFRTVVRNYSRGAIVPIEEAVLLIKPGFDKQYPKP